ncbi:MAG TPA: LysR substrate-binding domain-containing protein [Candidatus Saccharimonadales bacterium]|nr:LysR substrate-binding domain-containing protein [Candidatus Saccharimonadales bacterium]
MTDRITSDGDPPTFLVETSEFSVGIPCFIELRHLRCFDAVARSLNFTKAAERLHTGQPALSRTIMQLEEQLGCQVFARSGPNIKLTNAGQVLARQAEELLRAWDSAILSTRQAAQGMAGTLSLGVTNATMMGNLPELIARFRSERPLIAVQVYELEIDEVFSNGRVGAFDICFFYSRSNHSSPGVRILEGEPMFLALPKEHELSSQNAIALPMLSGEDLILSLTNEPFIAGGSAKSSEAGDCRPRSVRCVSNILTALGLVAAGFGITAVIHPDRLNIKGIKYIPLVPQPQYVAHLTAFWERSSENPVLPHFLRMLGLCHSGSRIASGADAYKVRMEEFESE